MITSKWLSLVLKGKKEKKREIRRELKLLADPLAKLKGNTKVKKVEFNARKTIFNMIPGKNNENDLTNNNIGIPPQENFSPMSAISTPHNIGINQLKLPRKSVLDKLNENEFIDNNIKQFLKYNERFKIEENLPKLDLIIEGIFYDEDFQIPEFIYLPKKKKKIKEEANVEVERRPFIGI